MRMRAQEGAASAAASSAATAESVAADDALAELEAGEETSILIAGGAGGAGVGGDGASSASSASSLGSPLAGGGGATAPPGSSSSSSSSSSPSGGAKSEADVVMDSAYLRKVLPAVSFWLVMSISVILFNKYLYMGPFKHPLTLTAVHMIGATIATQVLIALGKVKVPALGSDFYVRSIVPLGLMFAFSLGSSNLAAMRLSVSFIQMIKAVTPMMTLAVSVAYGTEKPYPSLLLIVSLMTFGVGIASYGEIEFDFFGLLLQLLALTVESVRLVAIQRVVQQHLPKKDPLVALSLFAPVCALFLTPVALFMEPGAFWKLTHAAAAVPVLLNTATAFSLNVAVVILVSHESGPLTLTLAGIIKDIALIISSIWLFANPITYIQVIGYALALYGLSMYHKFKAGMHDVPFAKLAKDAATDKVMMVMAAGLVLLLFVAQ